jgi:general secretion pathway protein A
MYLDYWNLQKAPFDNVPDPSMYADCHESMEKVIAETIFGIKEADEDFAVIIGAVGAGKTLALKVIMGALAPEKYNSVLITNPGMSFAQMLKEIISKITSEPCAENRKLHLLLKFHRLLFKTAEKGQKIVIFIDEADSMSPANLDNLRLLTIMQDDQRNLLTLVLAGQMELARRLEHPKRANLFQRIGIYGRIDKLPSVEAVKKYIEMRLRLAGTQKLIFPPESIQVIWDNSGPGIPRLVNKICKLCLIEAATGGLTQVSPELVLQSARRFQKLGGAAIQSRRPRCVPDDFDVSDVVEMTEEVIEMISAQSDSDNKAGSGEYKTVLSDEQPSGDSEPPLQTDSPTNTTHAPTDFEPPAATPPAQEADMPDAQPATLVDTEVESHAEPSGESKPQMDDSPEDTSMGTGVVSDMLQMEQQTGLSPESQSQVDGNREGESTGTVAVSDIQPLEEKIPSSDKKPAPAAVIKDDEIIIDGHSIRLEIPKEILERVKSFNRESALKSAGFWAAKILKKNPHLTNSPQADPVHIWNQIKDAILTRLSI